MVVCVLAVSDEVDEALYADLGPVRAAELIVACGDLPFDYLGYLMNCLDVPLAFVPGNHDPDLSGYQDSRAGLTIRAGLPARAPWPDGAVNADGRIVDIAGLRIAGLGGCRRYSSGPNQYSDRQQASRARSLRRRARWRRLRGNPPVDVLLTHAPPLGVGDGADPAHRGFSALHGLVAGLQPGIMLHGHVLPHDAAVPTRPLSGTEVRNVTGRHLLEIRPGRRHRNRATAAAVPETGFPRSDVENDFLRARRRQVLGQAGAPAAPGAGRRQPDPPLRRGRGRTGACAASGRSACRRSGWMRWSARSTRAATSTGSSGPPPAGCGSGGSGLPWPSAAARRSRRSTSTASGTCISCRTATTASRSRWRPARR